jgi:hypothetical protein
MRVQGKSCQVTFILDAKNWIPSPAGTTAWIPEEGQQEQALLAIQGAMGGKAGIREMNPGRGA